MRELLPYLITGVVTGSLYGLAGLGLVLTYRISGVFNFGHGAIAAGAAFTFYTLHVTHHLAWPLAALLTMIAFGVGVGWVMERITRGLGDVPEAVVVMSTLGILLGVEGLIYLLYQHLSRPVPAFLPSSGFTLSGVNVSWSQVISVGIASASAVALYWFLRQSRLGVAMRGVVDNPNLVALSGEDPQRVRQMAWMIGTGFAALSGMLLAPTLGLDANLLAFLVVQAFGAAALGLFKSLPLTYVGGIGVGVVASVATKYLTHAPWYGIPPVVPFLILLAVLLTVPVARFPQRRVSVRSLVPDVKPLSRRSAIALSVVGIGSLLIVPAVVGIHLSVWTTALIDLIIFSSLGLLVWTSGQISLCHAAFVAVGAATMGHLTTDQHLPWAVGLLLAGLVTVPVGAMVALPALRLSGLYLALATFGFGILMQNVIYPTGIMFGTKGGAGSTHVAGQGSVFARRPRMGFFNGGDTHFYYLVLALAVLCLVVMVGVSRSRLGRLLRAMSETPTMLATHGLDVNMTRLIVFCISAFLAGTAGALIVSQFGATSSLAYGPITSLIFLAVLAICGTRLIRGSILAAGLMAVVPGYLGGFDIDRQTFVFGMTAVLAGIVIAKRSEAAAALRRWIARPERPVARQQNRPTVLHWARQRNASLKVTTEATR